MRSFARRLWRTVDDLAAQGRLAGQLISNIGCALEPGRRFDFHTVDSDGFIGDFATTLTAQGDGTDLHWAVRMQPPGLLYRLLTPVIARTIRKSAETDFVELRKKLEA